MRSAVYWDIKRVVTQGWCLLDLSFPQKCFYICRPHKEGPIKHVPALVIMKLTVVVALLSSTSLTLGQGLPDLPSCSIQCFISAMSNDGCNELTDFACHCGKPSLVTEVTPCVEKACNEEEQSC
ncbi:hypothetical protein BDV18DRAFT_144558 [Aspergillus unguis]